jgi:hypothetical protein
MPSSFVVPPSKSVGFQKNELEFEAHCASLNVLPYKTKDHASFAGALRGGGGGGGYLPLGRQPRSMRREENTLFCI